jgi:HPt (histidine-containing phosphotransfer) domain-containing protein
MGLFRSCSVKLLSLHPGARALPFERRAMGRWGRQPFPPPQLNKIGTLRQRCGHGRAILPRGAARLPLLGGCRARMRVRYRPQFVTISATRPMPAELPSPPPPPIEAVRQNAIDVSHLASMTLGERTLAHQVLELFDRQAELLLARMREGPPGGLAGLAHTLCGSARGIGAFRVAAAAEAIERAAVLQTPPDLSELVASVAEARRAIATLIVGSRGS